MRSERAEADGIEVCRRRSGGGLVWIDPATDCWIDLIVPANSPLWHDDVGKSFHWLGETWAETLSRTVAPAAQGQGCEAIVHRTSGRSPAGKVWCFADLGHGEVSIAGSKVVGLSQRRTRDWARLQCLVLGTWPTDRVGRYVDLDRALEATPGSTRADLEPRSVMAGFPEGCPNPGPDRLTREFLAVLAQK